MEVINVTVSEYRFDDERYFLTLTVNVTNNGTDHTTAGVFDFETAGGFRYHASSGDHTQIPPGANHTVDVAASVHNDKQVVLLLHNADHQYETTAPVPDYELPPT